MRDQVGRSARAALGILGALSAISGCGMFDAYQREHHLKNDESTALILDAKQRVIIQRTVEPDGDFVARIKPGVITCAEPSPDVANALSTALTTSLAATSPSGSGAKSISADVAYSSAESIVQLGSRIATIQLLRDELADLCRSYANGAVTGTTYTLRLSRLDKKMVTLLLSEAAGRPLGTQAVIAGTSDANNRQSASAEEIRNARNAVVEAAKDLSEAEDAVAEASDETRAEKESERNDALKTLQEKNSGLLAMERRMLEVSSKGQIQTFVINAGAPAVSLENLATLQENFLLQDDLSTFLDACISSLDLLQRPLTDAERTALADSRGEVDRLMAELRVAEVKKDQLQTRFNEMGGSVAQTELEDFIRQYALMSESAIQARQRYDNVLSQLIPVSRFGEYCRDSGLSELIRANVGRIDARRDILQEQRMIKEAQLQMSLLGSCSAAWNSKVALDPDSQQACTAALARAKPHGAVETTAVSTISAR